MNVGDAGLQDTVQSTRGLVCMLSVLQAPRAPGPLCLFTSSFCLNHVLSSPLLFKNQLQHSLWKLFSGPCLLPCAPLNSVPPTITAPMLTLVISHALFPN